MLSLRVSILNVAIEGFLAPHPAGRVPPASSGLSSKAPRRMSASRAVSSGDTLRTFRETAVSHREIDSDKRISQHLSWPRVMRVFQHEAVPSRSARDRPRRVNAYSVRADRAYVESSDGSVGSAHKTVLREPAST